MILTCLLLMLSAGSAMCDTLKVNTSIKPPFSTKDEAGFFDLLVKELGKRIGHEVEFVRQPPARALFSANEGVSDVELPRIAGMEKKYPNLVMVGENIIDYNFVAFMRGPDSEQIQSWGDLKELRIGYLHGWKIFENNVPSEATVDKLNKPNLLFDMLENGRIDVALYESYAGWNNLRAHGHTGIHECKTPLAVKPMYMYFHKAHADLVPRASKALRQMKADGTYDKIKEQTLGK